MSVFNCFDLKGKNALVTGSSRGIGKAIAYALADAGATVWFHGSHESPALLNTVKTAASQGWNVNLITADLSKKAEWEKLNTTNALQNADILVLNASIQKYGPVEEFEIDEFENEFRVNLAASFWMIQQVLPGMIRKKWGRVLALGSVNQWKQSPRLPVYATTKSALSNLIQNCARKYGPDGITFNTLAPGVIATDRNSEALSDPEIVNKLLANIPAKRFGSPEDCAALALLLCSNAGSYITGSDIPVAGGMQL